MKGGKTAREDSLQLLREAVGTYLLCRCYFTYDPNYWYFYLYGISDKLMLGAEEDDFLLDGFQIRRIADLRSVEKKDDLCVRINEENQLLSGVKKPAVDLSSWETVFKSLQTMNCMIIVQNDHTKRKGGVFHLGYVTGVEQSHIIFTSFDADGKRTDDIFIDYDTITSVTFGDRYSTTWQKYLCLLQIECRGNETV